MPEEKNEVEIRDVLENATRIPGVIAALFTVGVVCELLGVISQDFSTLFLTIFTFPFILLFFTEIMLDREVSTQTHIGIMLITSYLLFMLDHLSKIKNIVNLSGQFCYGAIIVVAAMLVYYTIYFKLLSDKGRRSQFFGCYIPTVIIISGLIFIIHRAIGIFV